MKITNIKKENVLNIVILIFGFFPLIPNNQKGLSVILLLVISIVLYKRKKIKWKWLLINSSLFLIYLITLLYTDNYEISFKKLETGLSIVIIPLSFFLFLSDFRITEQLRTKFFKLFILSTGIFSIILIVAVFGDNSTIYYKDWYTNKFRIITENISMIGQHPIYASVFLSLAIIFFIQLLRSNTIFSFKNKIIYYSLTVINSIFLFMLLSKGVVISLLIVMFLMLFDDKKLKKYRKIFVVSIILVFLMLLFFNRRMNELVREESYQEVNSNFSTSIRLGIYKCSIEMIRKEWFFGYGVGDSQNALDLCYQNKSDILFEKKYNTHNQYLDVLIKSGVFGLIIFLSFLTFNIFKTIRNRNKIGLLVLIFYMINFLTENILVRQSGVILFYFLICFLNSYEMKKVKTLN